MSSASSTARWIDCTVDSMLTTTPFFRPREGCEPRPNTSIEPSSPTSPTSDTTFDVPMSSPTIRFRSERLSIPATVFFSTVRRSAPPSDCKTVRVAHVDIGDIVPTLCDELQSRVDEFVEPFVDLPSSQPHGHAVGQIEFPGAACIQAHRGQPQTCLCQPTLRAQVTLRDERLLTIGPGELRQLRRHVRLVLGKQLAAGVEQAVVAPAG